MKTVVLLVGLVLGGGERELGCWGDLPTPEEMATEIWPLVRSMVGGWAMIGVSWWARGRGFGCEEFPG